MSRPSFEQSLDKPIVHPPRPHFAWPLRALAFVLRRMSVLVAVIAVWQRVGLRKVHGVEWTLEGSCKSCGRCCENLMLRVDKLAALPLVIWLRKFWHEGVNDFYPKQLVIETSAGPLQAYGCRNWTADRRCARYELRPFVCRAYPALSLLDRPSPQPHCGYRVRQGLENRAMSRLVLTDGRRELAAGDLEGELCAYDRALDVLHDTFGLAKHAVSFAGVDGEDVVFRVSRELALPAGYQWAKRDSTRAAPTDPKRAILTCARVLGFPLAGVASPVLPARYLDRFDGWLASGAAAGMGFLARRAAERRDPERVLRGVRSVIALATPYSPVDASHPSARIARYAQSKDYHEALDKRLHALKRFAEGSFGGKWYLSVDTGPVLERAYAEQAGLGWIGKNGVLISRTHGSYLSLATLWTTLELAKDAPHDEHCGSCSECLRGCPTQAITAPGFVDARKCLSYWTIEHEGSLDGAPPQHGWLFGCDVCQEVCPWNRFAGAPVMRELAEKRTYLGPRDAWVRASDEDIERAIAGTPLRRAAARGLRRNALRIINCEVV